MHLFFHMYMYVYASIYTAAMKSALKEFLKSETLVQIIVTVLHPSTTGAFLVALSPCCIFDLAQVSFLLFFKRNYAADSPIKWSM